MKSSFFRAVGVAASLTLGSGAAFSQTAGDQPAAPSLSPGLTGPLTANPNPFKIDTGPFGTVYVGGIVDAYLQAQDHHLPGDRKTLGDIGNAQVFIQKADGVVQYYIQAGVYSLPSVGTPYVKASTTTDSFFGPLPVAYLKIAPTDSFNVMAGKLPTMIGVENTFTFQNRNIERGILWNQTADVMRGVQANFTTGPWAFSLAWSDGYYSDRWNWVHGSATYTIDSSNSVVFVGSATLGHTDYSSAAVPLYLNNQQLYNLMYTYSAGAWTVAPNVQYSRVPRRPEIGARQAASTYGAGLWVQYAFSPSFSLPLRAEYISSTGTAAAGAPNLIYGPGSKAWALTATPTLQVGRFFTRVEGSYVKAVDMAPGSGFGIDGKAASQARLIAEVGVMF